MSPKALSTLRISTSRKLELVDITAKVSELVRDSGIASGICHVFVPHTTAAVTINENADPDVRSDMLKAFGKMVPSDITYEHAEGNSPAHILASMVGPSLAVPIESGSLVLGTWQGIYFCEFDGPRSRNAYVKITEG